MSHQAQVQVASSEHRQGSAASSLLQAEYCRACSDRHPGPILPCAALSITPGPFVAIRLQTRILIVKSRAGTWL